MKKKLITLEINNFEILLYLYPFRSELDFLNTFNNELGLELDSEQVEKFEISQNIGGKEVFIGEFFGIKK